jgi:hypothetical protein
LVPVQIKTDPDTIYLQLKISLTQPARSLI